MMVLVSEQRLDMNQSLLSWEVPVGSVPLAQQQQL